MSEQQTRLHETDGSSSQRLRALVASAGDVQREERIRLERAINLARWGAAVVVFAVGPAFPNIGLPYVLGLGLFLLLYGAIVRMVQARLRGLAATAVPAVTFSVDILVTSAAMLVFAPDWQWTTFVYGALIVIIGAFRFGRRGAFVGAGALGVAYVAIALYREPAYGHLFNLSRAVSNVGFLFLTAMLMSAILRELHALRARQSDFYEPLLRAQSDLGEIIIVNEGTRPVYWNDALMTVSGRDRWELASLRSIYELLVPAQRELVNTRLRARIRDGRGDTFESELLRPDGSSVPIEVAVQPFHRDDRDWVVVVARDISARREAEGALQHQALHDPLTGLANRTLLADRLELAIAQGRRDDSAVALLVMDLDDFKNVNDTLGHHAGDTLLTQLGARLRGLRRATDTLGRLGGDEFAVVLPGADAFAAEIVARDLLRALETPFLVDGRELEIGTSIGISLFPELASDGASLLRQADMAMYVAKRQRSGCAVYEPVGDGLVVHQPALTVGLRAGLERGEFRAYYQPIVRIGGTAVAMEALVRWCHPERGVLLPGEFIRLAEQSGLIRPLFRTVLSQAIDACRSWRDAGWPLTVAVNLSVRNIQDPELIDVVADALRRGQLDASSLTLEITESAIIADPVSSRAVLQRLRALGVRLALDDFGTGYSSLSHVHQLPVQQLKIDRSFIRTLTAERSSAALVRSTIELGHNFDLEMVAEGVEDAHTLAVLGEMGCDTVQGFHFARPMPAGDVLGWIAKQPRSLEPLRDPEALLVRAAGRHP